MSARQPALFLTTAIMLAIVMGFIAYSSSALGRDALDELFATMVAEEASTLAKAATGPVRSHPLSGCRVRLSFDGVGFPVVREVVTCRRAA